MLISPLPSSKRLQYHFGEPLKLVVVVENRAMITLTVRVERERTSWDIFQCSHNPLTLISPSERILERNGGIITMLELCRMTNAVWFPLYHIGTSGHTVVEEGVCKDNNGPGQAVHRVPDGPGSCADIATGTCWLPSITSFLFHSLRYLPSVFPLV